MGIDPNIVLGIKPPQFASPMEHAINALQMRGAQQQVQQGDMTIAAAERAAAEAAAERALFARNPNATAADLAPIVGGQKAVAYGKGVADQKKSELETARARATIVTQMLQSVNDDASFALAKQGVGAILGPEAVAELGDTYDAARVKAVVARGIEAKDFIDAQFKASAEGRAAETHAATLPGVQADSTKKQTEALDAQLVTEGRLLGAATNNAEWQAALAQLDPTRAKRYPSIFSRQHKEQAVRAALTAQQRIDNAQQDQQIAISRQQAGEQARHNRVMESKEPLEAIQGPDGQPIFVPRSQAVGKAPAVSLKATEDERKMAGFYTTMRDAISTLDEVEGQLTEQELYQIQTLPQEGLVGMANRGQLSEPAKRYLRAFEQFTESRLRPVSGAAISDAEYARDRRTYAKQFSETPKLNEDRRRARDGALSSLRTRAGVLAPKDVPPPNSGQSEADKRADELIRKHSGGQ